MSPAAPIQHDADYRDYLRIARFDHVTKHVFIIPGVLLAILLRGSIPSDLFMNIVVGFMSATCVASANYVINEWLDREFDAHHPEKSQRAAVQREMNPAIVYSMYAVLVVLGLSLASFVNPTFLKVSAVFVLAGVAYNVQPLRTKDLPYVDVLSESLNNPIRLMLGWAMVDPTTLPPASLLLGFWFGGAFLMNSKRLAEYRDIVASDGAAVLERYRRSFQTYTEGRLSVANLVYAILCSFFMAVFLIKYRVEYVILFPFLAALFAEYYSLALKPDSVARKPERLFKARPLMAIAAATCVVFLFATWVDMPILERLTDQHFIDLTGKIVE